MQSMLKEDRGIIHTTIGELIEAISEIALEAGNSEAEGYRLASKALESILRKNCKQVPLELQRLN